VTTAETIGFDDIIAPVTRAEFFADYYDKKPLHIPAADSGNSHRFDKVMNWDRLNTLLNMTPVWNSKSLLMVLDTKMVPAAAYCEDSTDRYGNPVQSVDPVKVMDILRRGASLVANDIDSLTPEMRDVSTALENAFTGKVQINLYCSWAAHKAFTSHFDTHDVMALHVAGEKTWRVYENRMPHPVRHRRYGNEIYTDLQHTEQKGDVMMEITMRPGDVLYLPRGWYHDALADSPGAIHLACGITGIIGFDLLDALSDVAVDQELFRRNFPREDEGEEALNAHLDQLRDLLVGLIDAKEFRKAYRNFQHAFRTSRGGMALPVSVVEKQYAVTSPEFKVQEVQGRSVLSGPKGKTPIPPAFLAPVMWVLNHRSFTRAEFLKQSFVVDVDRADKALHQLVKMDVISESEA